MQDSTTTASGASHASSHTAALQPGHAAGAIPGEHAAGAAHPPYLAHHFDTPKQQYESSKLGMWLFLATEILMFGGLFCAYSVYRSNHPEIYAYAHRYLDTSMGALNTVILIASSFTMAWAVRAAQRGQKTLLVTLLALTLAGACGFMVVKSFEYNAKFSHHLGPGPGNLFYPVQHSTRFAGSADPAAAQLEEIRHLEAEYGIGAHGHAAAAPQPAADAEPAAAASPVEQSIVALAPAGPAGIAADAENAGHHVWTYETLPGPEQERAHMFFQIYFVMTGLHGIHVLIGMGLITYLLVRAVKGHFNAAYFTPVDIIGLYWHLVDLIWIFLFPLLYLIH